MLGVLSVVAQLAIVAHAPDTVFACEAVDVTVAVSAPSGGFPRLVAPSFRPFDLLRSGIAPRAQGALPGSRATVLTEYRFTITTNRTGHFTIPAFEARAGNERVVSRPLDVAVRPIRGRGIPAVVARARIDTSTGLNLSGIAPPETVFVGQQATYEVAVFLNQTARDRLRRNPTFYPPEMQAMLAYDLPAPSSASRDRIGSQCFDALVYRRALFPLVAGRLVIPPAQLVYSTGLSSASLFSREESHELQTDSVTIVAIEPPASGRPAEYAGAVGDVRLESRVDSLSSRVGDPMLFTVRIMGTGNIKLFPRPAVRVPWAGLVPADERVRIDSTSARVGGTKEFDWVLTPRIAGEFDVPPVRYGYFDPARRQYDVAVAAGSRVHVGAGMLATADTGRAESALSIRTRYGGPSWPPPQSSPLFWLALVLVPVPAMASRIRQRAEQRKRAAPPDPMRVLITTSAHDAVTLRRQFVKALAKRLGCNAEDFTHPGALERALRRAGVSEGTSVGAELLLRELDAAAYAGERAAPSNAGRNASAIARAVDEEALSRAELPFWIPLALLVLSLGVVGTAVAADTAASYFARGVSAYLREEYPTARHAFGDAVAVAPASADAWANFGTASWSAGDTSAAVFGWREALALEPDASDMQRNIGAVRELGPSAPGWVPSLPRSATVWLFAVLWITAWAFAWVSTRSGMRMQPWAARIPLPLAACALVVGLLSIELEDRIAGSRLAIVRSAVSLSSDPAIGMDRGPSVGTGEIVRVAGRRGAWIRVEATDDRDGWVAASQLLLIADRRPPRD